MSGQGKAPPSRRHRARARFAEAVDQHGAAVSVCLTEEGARDCPWFAKWQQANDAIVRQLNEPSGVSGQLRHDDLDFPRLLVFVLGLAIGAGMVGIAWGWS